MRRLRNHTCAIVEAGHSCVMESPLGSKHACALIFLPGLLVLGAGQGDDHEPLASTDLQMPGGS